MKQLSALSNGDVGNSYSVRNHGEAITADMLEGVSTVKGGLML